ncbi:MAG: HAD hydrolase-like protein [Zoogloeaceae bacterium]|nr:HAD hydrolase-like protein [Zoogloeaceae bacterium]
MDRYPHIIFDLDGTLIDSAPAILSSFKLAFETAGRSPARPISPEIIGPPLRETLAILTAGNDSVLIDELAAAFASTYDSSGVRETAIYPGVAEALRALLTQGRTLYIATNKRIAPTLKILDFVGWNEFFHSVYALDSFDPRLPDKSALLARLLEIEGLNARDCIYIGDRAEDGQAARANHLPFLAVTWGYGGLAPRDFAAEWRAVATPTELLTALS